MKVPFGKYVKAPVERTDGSEKIKNRKDFIDMISSYEFQQELLDRDPSRVSELSEYINPKIKSDPKYNDLVDASDWGLF